MQLDAKRSIPQEHKPRSKKIFVGGLAPETTEGKLERCAVLQALAHSWLDLAPKMSPPADDFRAYFEGFGRVSEAQIMQDHTSGRSRGFG